MPYQEVLTKSFLKDIKDIKKDKVLINRLKSKMDEILDNPERYAIKKYCLKGKRSVHVGSYVLLFEIIGKDVVFLKFKHHDYVYEC
jgi:addiction module RelE/StbE family toxin